MSTEYNAEWCKERHENIEKAFKYLDGRLKKVENRFLAMITILIMNLVGVIASLAVLVLKLQ